MLKSGSCFLFPFGILPDSFFFISFVITINDIKPMKKLLTIMAIVLTTGVQAQEEVLDTAQFVAVYNYQCTTQNDAGEPVVDAMDIVVQVGRTMTKSMPWSQSSLKPMSIEAEGKAYQEAYLHIPTIWMGWPEGQTTSRELIFPYNFEGKETTPEIQWTLGDDTLRIGDYLCQHATATFRGLTWQVYYTEEIPSSAGPWRLRGLPGLIVKAESGAHSFVLTQVLQQSEPITYKPDPEARQLSYKKLLKYRLDTYGNKQYAKNPNYYLPEFSELIKSFPSSQMTILKQFDAVFLDWRPMLQKGHVYQPLELKY
jgi:GLPGLI family protein